MRQNIKSISSATNPQFKSFLRMLEGKHIDREQGCIASGTKFIKEILHLEPCPAAAWIIDAAMASEALPGCLPTYQLSPALFRQIDIFGTHAPLLICKPVTRVPWTPEAVLPPGLTLFLPLQNPDNIGAAFRSARAFGVQNIILLQSAAHPFHPKALRAAGPTAFQLSIFSAPDIASLAKMRDTHGCYFLDANGSALPTAPLASARAILVGLEGQGIPVEIARSGWHGLSIPMVPGVESLNATVALSVVLYAAFTKR